MITHCFNWTSYPYYAGLRIGSIDTGFARSIFASQSELLQYLNDETAEKCMEAYETGRVTDGHVAEMIKSFAGVQYCQQLQSFAPEKRNEIIGALKAAGLSIRQIERLIGINRGIILRA